MRLAPQSSGSQGTRLWVLVWKRGQAWGFLSRCGAARCQDTPKSSPEVSEGSCKPPFFLSGGLVHPVPPGAAGFGKSVLPPLCPQQTVTPHSPVPVLGSGGERQGTVPCLPPGLATGRPHGHRKPQASGFTCAWGAGDGSGRSGGAGPEDQGGAPKVASAEGICS